MANRRMREFDRLVTFVGKLRWALEKEPARYRRICDAFADFANGGRSIAGVAFTVIGALEGSPELIPEFLAFVPDEFYDSLAFVNKVRDHFGGDEAGAYSSFLRHFSRLRRGKLTREDAVRELEDLLRGQGDLLEEFRTLLSLLKAYDEAAQAPPPPPPPPRRRRRASSSPATATAVENAASIRSKGKAPCSDTEEPEAKRGKLRVWEVGESSRAPPKDDEDGLSCRSRPETNVSCPPSPLGAGGREEDGNCDARMNIFGSSGTLTIVDQDQVNLQSKLTAEETQIGDELNRFFQGLKDSQPNTSDEPAAAASSSSAGAAMQP